MIHIIPSELRRRLLSLSEKSTGRIQIGKNKSNRIKNGFLKLLMKQSSTCSVSLLCKRRKVVELHEVQRISQT